MYAKGYRYRIRFQGDHIPSLCVKSIAHASELMRTEYPNEKNYLVTPLKPNE